MSNAHRTVSRKEWIAEGRRLFGDDQMKWRFVCPSCGYVASVQDWKDCHAPDGAVAFSCVGRWKKLFPKDAFTAGPGPCNYAGGGLFRVNPVTVTCTGVGLDIDVFEFAKGGQS